jgi:hypothetical protein
VLPGSAADSHAVTYHRAVQHSFYNAITQDGPRLSPPLSTSTAYRSGSAGVCGPFRRRSCAALDWCDTELWSRNNCSMRQGSLGTPHASRVATAALSAECWRWRWRVLARALAGPGRHVSLCVPCWTSTESGRGSATCAGGAGKPERAASVRPCGAALICATAFVTDCPVRLGSFAGLCYCT